jgi:hypothetical protein
VQINATRRERCATFRVQLRHRISLRIPMSDITVFLSWRVPPKVSTLDIEGHSKRSASIGFGTQPNAGQLCANEP